MAVCPKCNKPMLTERPHVHDNYVYPPGPVAITNAVLQHDDALRVLARKLSRYDEAVSLLRECRVVDNDLWAAQLTAKIDAFMATEPTK